MRKQFVAAVIMGLAGFAVESVSVAQDLEMAASPAPPQQGVTLPARGSNMNQVEGSFGPPGERVAAVGQPPISRWIYAGFVVYFEHDHVVHAVVTGR